MGDVFQWLPDETEDRQIYDRFVQQFGVDDFVVVTWPKCSVKDKRCDRFTASLLDRDTDGLIEAAVSGRDLIRKLIGQSNRRPSEIIKRFRGIYFGDDERSTCVVVMLTAYGMDNRSESIEYVQESAKTSIGIDENDLILAGYPQVGAYGDDIVRRSIIELVGPSCLFATFVAWLCLRNLKLTILILATGGLAAGLSVAVVILSGSQWGGLSSVIPTLAYVLSVSGGMHLVNYARTPGSDRLLYRVLRIGWKPCLLSALTTVAGMLSLCGSNFPAIREFGAYCACGVLASLICQLVLIPPGLDWIQFEKQQERELQTPFGSWFLKFLLFRPRMIVATFIAGTAIAAVGLLFLRSDLEVERNFSRDAPVMKDIAWFEDTIGPVEQTELLITFNDLDTSTFGQRLAAIRNTESVLRNSPDVFNVLSAAAWLPDEPKAGTIRSTAAKSVYGKLVAEARDELVQTNYLSVTDSSETWRLSLRFPFLMATDFAAIHRHIPELVQESFDGELTGADVSIQHTGVSLLYHVAQGALVADLYRNFATAFALICPLMMLVLRSFKQGAVSMIPNLCPAVVAYGILGWCDYPIDVGMAMTACVALGIAVDDTTHFMLRFDDLKRESLGSDEAALQTAFAQCSRAMLHTTLITGVGLVAFMFGWLVAMTRFAGLLIGLISIALLCDLVLLPSLLATLGIKPRQNNSLREQ